MAINYSGVVQNGTFASRPAASAAGPCMYYATDTGIIYSSDGATWTVATGWVPIFTKDFTDSVNNQTFSDADAAYHNVTIGGKTWVTGSGTAAGGNVQGVVSGATWGIDANGLNIAPKDGTVTVRDFQVYAPLTTLSALALVGKEFRVWMLYSTSGETSPAALNTLSVITGFGLAVGAAPQALVSPRAFLSRQINVTATQLVASNNIGVSTSGTLVTQPASTDVLVCTLMPAMSVLTQSGVSVAGAFPAESALTTVDSIPQLGAMGAAGQLQGQGIPFVVMRYLNSTVQTPKLTIKRVLVEMR